MNMMQVQIFSPPLQFPSFAMNPTNQESTMWEAVVSLANLSQLEGKCAHLNFSGTDTNGNELLNVHDIIEASENNRCMIPTRREDENNLWTNYPNNSNHVGSDKAKVCFYSCNPGGRDDYDCSILSQISPEVTYIDCSIAEIDLNISPDDIDYDDFVIRWFDPEGNEMVSEIYQTLIVVTEAGMYCYEMEGYEGCCSASGCMEVIQENMDAQLKIEIDNTFSEVRPVCNSEQGFIPPLPQNPPKKTLPDSSRVSAPASIVLCPDKEII
jgi:hypothetical protein